MFDLTGKCTLVTGASGGIGQAIARALHGAGAKLALSGTREDALSALAGELADRTYVIPGDLADRETAESLIGRAEAVLGQVDILINNAGITRDTLLLRMKDEDWQSVLDVDLTAAMRLTRAALRGMIKRRFGRIVNITSIVGATGNPGQTNYAAAKAGLVGFSKALAQEVAGRGITVNCLAPGFIATPMTDKLGEEQKQKLLGQIPVGRLGTGADVAAAALFLASMEAGYITGQSLHVNGGMAMI
jgi:3-oxoacyl-[acyl-carrier protein] reductase